MKRMVLSLSLLMTLFAIFTQLRPASLRVKAQVPADQRRLQVQTPVRSTEALVMRVPISVRNIAKSKMTPREVSSLIHHASFIDADASARDSACEKESSLRSKEGVTPVEFTLANRSKITVVLYWINYEGKRVKYDEVAPGFQVKQPTYLTHPWVVADTKGRCIRILTPPGDFVIE